MSGKALCTACELWFAGDESFDRHRVPLPRSLDPEPPSNRCLTVEEMVLGEPLRDGHRTPWRLNAHGLWTHRPPLEGDLEETAQKGWQVGSLAEPQARTGYGDRQEIETRTVGVFA